MKKKTVSDPVDFSFGITNTSMDVELQHSGTTLAQFS